MAKCAQKNIREKLAFRRLSDHNAIQMEYEDLRVKPREELAPGFVRIGDNLYAVEYTKDSQVGETDEENEEGHEEEHADQNDDETLRCPKCGNTFKRSEGKVGDSEFIRYLCGGMIDVVAELRDENDDNLRREIEYFTRTGIKKVKQAAADELLLDASKVIRRLAKGDLELSDDSKAGKDLVRFLRTRKCARRIKVVSRRGWFGRRYVTKHRTIGFSDEEIRLDPTVKEHHTLNGTVGEWRETLGQCCIGNGRLLLAACAGFASPLLSRLEMNTFIVHIAGKSTQGKTISQDTARSVTGSTKEYWDQTKYNIEHLAYAYSDSLLALDEINRADTATIGNVLYMLGQNKGGGRFGRATLEWSTVVYSTGEKTLEEYVPNIQLGQIVRSFNIAAAPKGGTMGVFQRVHHGFVDPGKFAKQITKWAKQTNGEVLMAFLQKFVEDFNKNKRRLEELMALVEERVYAKFPSLPDAAKRVLDSFLLLAAAGELATEFGITGWPEGEATWGVLECFESWLDDFRRSNPHEFEARPSVNINDAVDNVFAFLDQHRSQFQARSKRLDLPSELWGWHDEAEDQGNAVFYVLPKTFREEVCEGYDAEQVAKELRRRGLLICQPGNLTTNMRFFGYKATVRVYALKMRSEQSQRPQQPQRSEESN